MAVKSGPGAGTAGPARRGTRRGGLQALPADALDAFFGSYSQLLFARSRGVGVLLVAATFVTPRLGLVGALSVATAIGLARVLRFSPDLIRSGLFGYNALLVGLAGAALLEPSPAAWGLTALAVVTSVLVTAAAHSVLSTTFGLPALTVPFLVVAYLVLAAAPGLGVPIVSFPGSSDPLVDVPLPALLDSYLASLGTIFFQPHAVAGLLVFAALISFSRIGTGLSLVSYLAAYGVVEYLYPGADPVFLWVLVLNMTFVALALGGVWFVPSGWAYLLAMLGIALAALVSVGSYPILSQLGLPLMIFPFNATMLLLLVAMRQRIRDGRPKAVDFVPGTPEENLSYYRTRVARFGSNYGVRLHAPFRGRWVCTQGTDGPHTHRGSWRHGADFEVLGPDGRTHRGEGHRREDYHGYRLPVLATADGTVTKVVDGVVDNEIGESNLAERWGNLVLLYHGPGLYSLVAHLAPGSIRATEGQVVRQGDPLGLCGSSGRSPVPHLHFQLQATPVVGAPTIHLELHDVVSGEAGAETLESTVVPAEGQQLRNVEPRPDIARMFALDLDRELLFELDGGKSERIRAEIGLFGASMLRSDRGRATLFFDASERLWTAFDVVGPRRSLLHLWRAALGRVPFEVADQLTWTDHLPARHVLPWPGRLAVELLPTREGRNGIRMRYRARRDGRVLVLSGESERAGRGGDPLVRTEARVDRENGPVELTMTVAGRTRSARRILPSDTDGERAR